VNYPTQVGGGVIPSNTITITRGGGRPLTHKPGEIVPRDGTVQCTQHPETRDQVKKGTRFAPCDHWGDHDRKDCTWQYID